MSRWYPCASMLRTATAVVVAAISAGQLQAVESQILETYNDTHTSYKAGATTVQGVLPHHGQRGVSVDGTLRAQPTFPWAVAGNPQGWDWNDQMTYSGIRLDMGAYMVTEVDIAMSAEVPWIIG